MKLFIGKTVTNIYQEVMWVYIAPLDMMCPIFQVKNYLAFSEIDSASDKYILRAVSKGKSLVYIKRLANFLFPYQRDLYFSSKSNGHEMKRMCYTYIGEELL